MTGKLDWSSIEDVFDLGGYSVDAALTDSAAFLAILGLTLLQPEWLWQNYDDFDDVETAIDDAIAQIMTQKLYQVGVTNTIAQTIADNGAVRLEWDTVLYDPQGMSDILGKKFTIQADGLYLLTLNMIWQANGDGFRDTVIFQYNPTTTKVTELVHDFNWEPSSVNTQTQNLVCQAEMLIDDTVSVYTNQSAGVDLDVLGTENKFRFSAVRLS